VVVDADKERREYSDVEGATAYEMLARHIEKYTPEWAETVCDVKAATIRRIANEYLEAASIGETIVIDGKTLPCGRSR
jgi:phenylacetyl-CoA:acceptor oxidoreductase